MAVKPNNWNRVERSIKTRAELRCECGTFWDCGQGFHVGRCISEEGKRYQHNSRLIKLRVVQLGPPNDWTPNQLVALCLWCLTVYNERKAHEQRLADSLAAQEDTLFDMTTERISDGQHEQN